jgi:hypothetical protein
MKFEGCGKSVSGSGGGKGKGNVTKVSNVITTREGRKNRNVPVIFRVTLRFL